MDNLTRKISLKNVVKVLLLKSQKKLIYSTYLYKLLTSLLLSLLPTHFVQSKIVNRCLLTGRVRGILKKTQSSRFIFRKFAYKAYLPGVSRYTH
jgi:ribosomal protein S14